MTRAGKESRQEQLDHSAEATSDSVDVGGPSRKRKDTSSSQEKTGKRRQSNNENTTSSIEDKKGKAKAETTNTLPDVMDVDNSGAVQATHDETDSRDTLKSPLADMDGNLAVMDDGGSGDQNKINPSDMKHNNSNFDHLEDTDQDDDMILDSSDDGSGDHFTRLVDEHHGAHDEYEHFDEDGEFDMYDSFGGMQGEISEQQFSKILENLKSNDQTQQLNTLQNLAETLSISSEEQLAGYFPCDSFARELVKILKGSDGPIEDNSSGITLNDEFGGGNPELMVLACRCISNLMDVFPTAAPYMINHGVIEVLCDKLRSIQYIDLAEQALEALKEIAGQTPMAVIQNDGLGATFMYFDFFNIYSQRTALQTATHCMRFINKDSYQQLVQVLPCLTNTLASSDRTIVELTCLCWARLSENYMSTRTEFEKVISMDILNTMIGILPVSGNTTAVRPSAFSDILRVFRTVAKASPTLGYQLLHADIIGYFYLVLTGATDIPSSPNSLISLDNTWQDSLYTILNIIIDLLPPLPKNQEFDWNRFKGMEPIALRTRSRTTCQVDTTSSSTSETTTTASSSSTAGTTPDPDPRTELLENNPQLLQRIGVILFPLLLEIYSSTVNLVIRQLVTHTLVKLVFFMNSDTLKLVLQDIPLSGFLAGLLAHQEHSAFMIDALFQAEFLLKKLPGVYSTLFRREGVYYETKALASKNIVEDDNSLGGKKRSAEETKGAPVQDNSPAIMHTNRKSGRSDFMERPSTYSLNEHSSISSLTITTAESSSHYHHTMRSDISQKMDSVLESRLLMAGTQLHQQRSISENGKSGIGHGLLRRFIIQLAQNHMKDYATAPSAAQDNLQVLNQFVDGLFGTPSDPPARKVLENLISYINKTAIGISCFELVESGLLEALLGYLTEDNGYTASLVHRRQAFSTAFLETLDLDQGTGLLASPTLRILVQRLETLFTRFERFEVILPLDSTLPASSSNSIVQNPVQLVTKQIRIRLQGQGPHIPAGYQHITMASQAITTFRVLEKYLLERIIGIGTAQGTHKTNNTLAGSDKTHSSSSTELMDLDKAELGTKPDSKNIPLQTSLQNHSGETASSSTSSVIGSPVSSSVSSPSSSSLTTGKSQRSRNGSWKIQFYINNTLISQDSSLYGAIHKSETEKRKNNESRTGNYNIWTTSYPVTFRCIFFDGDTDDSKTKETTPQQQIEEKRHPSPEQLTDDTNNTCLKILQLLKELLTLSQSSLSAPSGKLDKTAMALVPMTDFVNRKLAVKMQRQLEEPLIVASACLPDWIYYCMDNYPFLFPFDVRYLYIQSTSFGAPRLLANWKSMHMRNNNGMQNGQQHQPIGSGRYEAGIGNMGAMEVGGMGGGYQSTVGRIERIKYQVQRDQVFDDAIKAMDLYGNSKISVLEIEYMNEEGTGLGPTMEFYALASKEFCKKSTHMWRQEDDGEEDDQDKLYVKSQHGLFPAPLSKQVDTAFRGKVVRLFKSLGQFVAKSMLDFRMVDIPFNVAFFKLLLHTSDDMMELIMDIDPLLGKSISHLQAYVDKKRLIEDNPVLAPKERDELIDNIEIDGIKIEDLCLNFTLPGRADIDLKRDGSKTPVTIRSVEDYIQLLGDTITGSGVNEQLSAFRKGFNMLLPLDDLKVLTCQELVSLYCSSSEDWAYSILADAIKADHGFTMDSTTVKNLLEILSEMTGKEQREFLQFTTGSPRLPIGGWKSMRPMFTVVKKNCDAPLGPDDYLPSVMTCANYLKMPDYTNKEIMRKQLLKSMHEGKNSFLLS
ncbi:unnamed protein product [Absidia cylindrospora]